MTWALEYAEYQHVLKGFQYADDVTAGRIPACKWVRLACQRHLDDWAKSRTEPEYPYEFDPLKARKVCKFLEYLPHTKGVWAAKQGKAKLLVLEPWQCFIEIVVFGWVRKSDRTRRFREAYICIPRKNGKSICGAGNGLYMLAADEEYGAEVFSGAGSEKQAWEVFRPAMQMAKGTPALLAHYGIQVNASNINILANGSRFEPLIGKPGDGASPSCAIVDEFHEHDTPDLYNTMVTGMGARMQPLVLIITTAGDNLAGPCYDKQMDIQKILEGVIEDDEKFGIIYTIDPDDRWDDPAVLRKANPNYDISVFGDFLQARQKEAINNSRHQGRFKTKHLNVWVNSRSAFFNMQKWNDCADEDMLLEDFEGQDAYLSLDLASKIDIAALKILLPQPDGSYVSFGRFYLPESTVENTPNDHYRGWAASGRLIATDGDMIDFDRIEEDILDLCRRFNIQEVVYDPFQATMLVNHLQNEDVTTVEYRNTVQMMSDPMKQLEALILAKKWRHDGCPVMTWMMSNVVSRTDQKDNVFPNKEKPENKIDGPVALIMGLGRAMAGGASSAYICEDFDFGVG